MSKFQEALDLYTSEFAKLGVKGIDADLLKSVTKACGPSIYNNDASKVASSDQAELNTVKNNFLIKKLGMKDGPALDDAIAKVVDTLGASNRNKYRAMFYYLLVKHFGKESMFK
jgi:small subunit ribosomal protein S1